MTRIRFSFNVFALLHGIERCCTDMGASRLHARVGGINQFCCATGAAEQRQYFDPRMNTSFMKTRLIATIAIAIATAVSAIACSSAYAQSNLDSMRAEYSSGNPQRGRQPGSDSSLSPLLGPPPDYEKNYLSGDDSTGSTRSQTSKGDRQTGSTKSPQNARISSLYGAPTDYEDSYSAHLGSQPQKKDGARQMTSYGLAAVEGLSSPEVSGGGDSAGKTTARPNSGRARTGQQGNRNGFGSSIVVPESSFVARLNSAAGGDAAATFYRSPW